MVAIFSYDIIYFSPPLDFGYTKFYLCKLEFYKDFEQDLCFFVFPFSNGYSILQIVMTLIDGIMSWKNQVAGKNCRCLLGLKIMQKYGMHSLCSEQKSKEFRLQGLAFNKHFFNRL